MQRTMLAVGGCGTNTYTMGASSITCYSPLGVGGGPTNNVQSLTATGAYSRSNFACVLSKLYLTIGKIGTQNGAMKCQININGASGTAGNLSAVTPSYSTGGTRFSTPAYYYDATDLDAITAGQQVGFMETIVGTSGSAITAPCRGVACDSPNAGFSAGYYFSNINTFWNDSSINYSGVCGSPSSAFASTAAAAQHLAGTALVASGLQWANIAGNTSTSTNATCTLATSATSGTNTATSLAATIGWAGAVGQFYDATDIASIPAGNYYNLYWSGTSLANTLRIGNAGIHTQGASSNACTMATLNKFQTSWNNANPTYACMAQGVRYDDIWYETLVGAPTAGVYSSLYFNVTTAVTYASATTFTVWTGTNTGDTGGGSGAPPTAAAGFTASSLQVTVPATASVGWYYDATDLAAVIAGNQLLCQVYGTGGGATKPSGAPVIQAQSINFTAPAHLRLTTMGAG